MDPREEPPPDLRLPRHFSFPSLGSFVTLDSIAPTKSKGKKVDRSGGWGGVRS